MKHRIEIEIGGKPMVVETGKLARQADGSVTIQVGGTVVLVTAVAANTPREGVSFLPLTVDYRESAYSAGKIPGGFFKREGRPNEKEVLTCRCIDRPLRPLFPEGWRCETQIISMLLSSDQENDSDVMAITGASCALSISDIPFPHPIAAVRVGLDADGKYMINPTFKQLEDSRLNLIVAGSADAVVMVEAGAQEVSEDEILDAILAGHDEIKKLVAMQNELVEAVGRPKRPKPVIDEPKGLRAELTETWQAPLADAMRIQGKLVSYARVDELKAEMLASFEDDQKEERSFASGFWHDLQDVILREEILERDIRLDGRKFDEIRPITCEVGVLPRTHGSAVFTRGETQALATVTLGTAQDQQRLDWVEGESWRRFMLHYNFPPFSVGEARFLRGPGRREIGHGALGERSLLPMIPAEDVWPYTIRCVSEILESNGSSSMATVCGGSLAMMDAGIPLKSPVAGIAMGLVKADDKFVVMTDIAGAEDHHGDMDFKVAGTRDGITGLQMDIKIGGISRDIFIQALKQAQAARLQILDTMNAALGEARKDISPFAPRIVTITINKDKIRDIIGPGGKMIRSIIERTGCKIDVHDDGRVDIASSDEKGTQHALGIIKELTAEAELGKTYVGKVVRVVNFGAFIEILPGVEGLCHISEIANRRIGEVTDVLDEGDETPVKVIDIDGNGRVRLSRRVVVEEDGDDAPREGHDRGPRDRGPRDGDRGPRDRGRDRDRSRGRQPVGAGSRGGDRNRSDRGRGPGEGGGSKDGGEGQGSS